ncbi:hypothetical protein EXIGLDRAFT_739760 [Exidia glandulosa HHB12029]|uniref:Uncharacterized protein n=1 Tax=Exidia glandulosa HHB12029 TaxID=1314781 RepID=A0A165JRL5_EXIGL|nr:hypothetical protein EXIGLDRAFT_739760 [Exidia glandulosa HHB12029]
MPSRARSPSVEVVSSTVQPRSRSPSFEIISVTEPTPKKSTSASARTSTSSSSKRKSTDSADAPKAKRAKKTSLAAEKENDDQQAPKDRWKWIDSTRPEIEFKGTKILAHNCGGTFFSSSAKAIADRLDKLEGFLDECEGDETRHPTYGYPKAYKPKRVSKKNKDDETRWPWIDKCRPDLQLKGTKLEAYNCGGCYFKATGRNIAERLDKMEKFFSECEGDESCHPTYGTLI